MARDGVLARADRVAVAGTALALVGLFAFPFAEFRTSRIGVATYHGMGSGAPATYLLAGALAACVAVAVRVAPPRRGVLLKLLAGAAGAALAWSLGAAAARLLAGEPVIARVSIGAGAWVVLAGLAVVDFAARRALASRKHIARALDGLALIAVGTALVLGGAARLSLVQEYLANADVFRAEVVRHLALAGAGVAMGVLLGVPLGVWASRSARVRDLVLGVVGVIQTIPSLALIGLLIAPLAALRESSPLLERLGIGGIGFAPAVIALTLYALLPVVRNTYVGLAGVDPGALDAGRGMGMGRGQLLLRVELPLALPLMIEGLRAAAVLDIGIAAVMFFAGARGLGLFIFQGVGQVAADLTLLGALPIIALAVAVDAGLRALGGAVVSPGLRREPA